MEPIDIGGIRLNFQMPDLLSIALGGGSRITVDNSTVTNNRVQVGPSSVGYRLGEHAPVFGGDVAT